MQAVSVTHVAKTFGTTDAIVDVSFDAGRGEIFGLLGPNGAGKTTTIRIVLDIFKPDHGQVSVLGGPMTEQKKARIGYMPEERGLYQDIPLERCLLYLASLKGVPDAEAHRRLQEHLERFDLAAHKGKKVRELSKGMQQKAQIINTILHHPELIVVDEPFAALDPVNTQLVKDLMCELRKRGVTILMSTHQMHQVEELCDRILLIDGGRDVLYGDLDQVRRQYSGRAVLVRATGEVPAVPGATRVLTNPDPSAKAGNGAVKLALSEGATPQSVLWSLMSQGVAIEKFEIAVPTLDEIFIQVVAPLLPGRDPQSATPARHASGGQNPQSQIGNA